MVYESMKGVSAVKCRRNETGVLVSATGPGLVDLQVNGYAGLDFNGPVEALTVEAVRRVCLRIRRRGVVTVLATLITDAPEAMVARAARLTELRQAD